MPQPAGAPPDQLAPPAAPVVDDGVQGDDNVPPELLPPDAQGLVFDCDGTLLDSMGFHLQAWRATGKLFGIEVDAAALVEFAGKPVHELLDILATRSGVQPTPDLHDQFFAHLKSEYYADDAREVHPIESVLRIVRAGAARGLPMAVASGGTRHHVSAGLRSTGLDQYFGAVVCGEDVARGKPEPDAFLLAASKIGVAPARCVGYEDAALGMEAIRRAGFLAAVDVTQLEGYPHLTD